MKCAQVAISNRPYLLGHGEGRLVVERPVPVGNKDLIQNTYLGCVSLSFQGVNNVDMLQRAEKEKTK
jgi:hypothetical protein